MERIESVPSFYGYGRGESMPTLNARRKSFLDFAFCILHSKKQFLCCERRPYTLPSGFTPPRSLSSLLRTGNLAAHTVYRLMLLDPSPDMVHGSALREDPFVNTRKRTQFGEDRLSGWESTPAVAGCRYRAPLSPRLVWPTFTAEALLTRYYTILQGILQGVEERF